MQNINNPDQKPSMSLTSLLCEENNEHGITYDVDVDDDDGDDQEPLIQSSVYSDYAIFTVSDFENDGFVEILLSREIDPSLVRSCEVSNAGRNNLRDDAVNYIFNMRSALGFQFQTAYLALVYFDLFLSKRSIDDEKTWAIQLLAVACLTLAAKLEEYKVPNLSEFQVGPYNFQGKVVQKMELLVLHTLEWKMGLVTPFSYLPYFINQFCQGPPSKATISRIINILLAIVKEINLIDHRHYAIACASIMVALDQRLSRATMESMINTIPCSKNLDMEDIFTCYNLMEQLELKTNEVTKLPHSRAMLPIDVSMDPRASSSHNSKRKRLEFDKVDDQTTDKTSEDGKRRCF